MEDDVLINSDTMTEIADAIREKTGKTDLMYPRDMPDEIASIDISEAAAADAEWINGSLKTVEFPKGIKTIPEYLFYNFTELELYELPDTIENIGRNAFYGCKKVELSKLPENLIFLGGGSFQSGPHGTLQALPPRIEQIGENMWWSNPLDDWDLSQVHYIPKSVKALYGNGNGALAYTNLEYITFLGVPQIMTSPTFNGNKNLTEINVPWEENEIAGAPWGATNATINYNYVEEA